MFVSSVSGLFRRQTTPPYGAAKLRPTLPMRSGPWLVARIWREERSCGPRQLMASKEVAPVSLAGVVGCKAVTVTGREPSTCSTPLMQSAPMTATGTEVVSELLKGPRIRQFAPVR